MKNAMKKLTSLLLVAVLLVGALPFAASAAENDVSFQYNDENGAVQSITVSRNAEGKVTKNAVWAAIEANTGRTVKNVDGAGMRSDGTKVFPVNSEDDNGPYTIKVTFEVVENNGTGEGAGEGTGEGAGEGTGEGAGEGTGEGAGEGTGEGTVEGTGEGTVEGTGEGTVVDTTSKLTVRYNAKNGGTASFGIDFENYTTIKKNMIWSYIERNVGEEVKNIDGDGIFPFVLDADKTIDIIVTYNTGSDDSGVGSGSSSSNNTNNGNATTYTVTFYDVNNSVCRTATVEAGKTISTDDLYLAALGAGSKSGSSFYGWYYNGSSTAFTNDQLSLMPITGNTTLKAAFTANASKLNNYQVYLHIYKDTLVGSADKQINITTGIALDGKVTLSEVKSLVMNYYTAKNSYGIGFDGLYLGEGDWVYNYVVDQKYDEFTNVNDMKESHDVVIKVMITNATAKSTATADSSNPKTGDSIYTAMAVMGMSAAALAAVMYVYNKKRQAI